ncbi:MAG: hypothetical protein IPM99_07185 [Rubrivivax sp.]|jgi:hypothetical protein|nr:hypothetical protein [Rubrivivax sp.]
MKKFLIALTAALTVVAFNAVAHGDAKPLHGGIVQVASDLQFELVPQPNGATLYVVDHDKPADTSKMSGKLTVLNGTEKSEVALRPSGANKLEAADVKIAVGSKVVASVTGANGKATTVRFSVK